jgi:O-antigen biosynthesis protein WbqP
MNRSVARTRRRSRLFAFAKRLFDIVVSATMLLVLLPVLLVIAVAVAVDTKASPFFLQTRMGRHNVPFCMWKFRTMSPHAPANVATYKLNNAEKYISRLGGFLRRASLDELPQLWNILKGDMSFIGPRPVVLTETSLLTLRARNGANTVRPGLTGWAQVNGRDNVQVTEKAMLDAYYVRRFSLALDLRIMWRSVSCVLHADGVSEGANAKVDNTSRHTL